MSLAIVVTKTRWGVSNRMVTTKIYVHVVDILWNLDGEASLLTRQIDVESLDMIYRLSNIESTTLNKHHTQGAVGKLKL